MTAKYSAPAAVLMALLTAWLACRSAPAPIREIAGCYAVTIGSWVVDPRNPTRPNVPPDTISLSTIPVTTDSPERYQVQPDAFAENTRGASSYWARVADSVIIQWSVAFGGISMRVKPTASGLDGRIESWTDVVVTDGTGQVPSPSAPVHLVRSRCAKPDAA